MKIDFKNMTPDTPKGIAALVVFWPAFCLGVAVVVLAVIYLWITPERDDILTKKLIGDN